MLKTGSRDGPPKHLRLLGTEVNSGLNPHRSVLIRQGPARGVSAAPDGWIVCLGKGDSSGCHLKKTSARGGTSRAGVTLFLGQGKKGDH